MSYFNEDNILPSPFNLISIPGNLINREKKTEEDIEIIENQNSLREIQYQVFYSCCFTTIYITISSNKGLKQLYKK